MTAFDHLVYAAPDLQAALEDIARRTGVHPTAGGPHPGLGTRNYLLGLGGDRYLEIIGPDPAQPTPPEPRPFGIDDLSAPKLVAWAIATTDLDAAVTRSRAAGHDPGPPRAMTRLRPDGELLRWRLTPPRAGVVPFLIDWGATPHPARRLPVVQLVGFEVVHPAPDAVRECFTALGADAAFRQGARPALVAHLAGPAGEIVLD
ncbi:VOC family protein [Catenulispora pinisilvae]|uniref:VOC family protein n=1 Tax=Catenulispora pinisilvae TaxID=2705253 RepID=UPI001891212C|nr:VOC family protein [Catenulispora pinisilvae]